VKCCDIYPGLLNRQVDLLQKSRTPDGAGGWTASWTLVLRPWAWMKPANGREVVYAQRLDGIGPVYVYCRYNALINETLMLRYEGRDYNIRSVIDIEMQHTWMELVCERGVAN
jgi:SPP1 family predicted phage head-tail adaptor